MIVDLKKVTDELEDGALQNMAEIDAHAMSLYRFQPERAVEYLTDYSVETAEKTVSRWKDLYGYLLVKYMDGNIKVEKDGQFARNPYGVAEFPEQPDYPEFWLRAIVKDHREAIKAPK